MAYTTYYWLGKVASTGTGNVNNPSNWTTIGPTGLSGGIPASASNPPGSYDIAVFTRFVGPGGTVYPLYSPGGTLGTGVSGTTGMLTSLEFRGDCPVPLGISGQSGRTNESLNVNTIYASISQYGGITNGTTWNAGWEHYINFKDNKIGAVPNTYDPVVSVFSNVAGWQPTFRISGFIGTLLFNNTSMNSNKNILWLDGATLSSRTSYGTAYKAFHVGSGSNDEIYISRKNDIVSSVIGGNATVYISPGFGTTGSINLIGITGKNGPILEFVVGPSGACMSDPSVTKINNLNINGVLLNPIVRVNHGVGITSYYQSGGDVNFNVAPGSTLFMCTIDSGTFVVGPNGQTKLSSQWPTVVVGKDPNGFVIENYAYSPPNIRLNGLYDIYSNPISM